MDLEHFSDLSQSDRFGSDRARISTTQAEVLQAIQKGIPVFAFIDGGVQRDHLTYEKNKNKAIITEIEFSSIEQAQTAPYIFEFINFLRLRNENNSIFEFSRFEDLEHQLKKQWAGLFQRLLHEQRTRAFEVRRMDNLSSQIADLKAAVLGSISSSELKETAKGAIRFRLLVEFIYNLAVENPTTSALDHLRSHVTWAELLQSLGIVGTHAEENTNRILRAGGSTILIRSDDTFYRTALSLKAILRLEREWENFLPIGPDAKNAIIDAVLDSRDARPNFMIRHHDRPYLEGETDSSDGDADWIAGTTLKIPGLRTRSLADI